MCRKRNERRGRRQLAGEDLLQIDRLQPTGAGELDVGRRQRRLQKVGGRRERGAAERVHDEEHLVVLEIGRLEPRLDAVREADDGDAEAFERTS